MLDEAELHLHASVDGPVAVVQAAGELDIYTSSQLLDMTDQLCVSDVDEIVLRGDDLRFVDSAGLRALVLAHDRASERGIDLRVASASEALEKVLAMTGLDELLVRSGPDRSP